jgi:3D (Asp-Asp-Asp) domain-containing protein
MLNDTLSDNPLPKGVLNRRTLVRNIIVLSSALAAMQLVAMKSAELVDSKGNAPSLKYKTAALSYIQLPRFDFLATAYSYQGITKSGLPAAPGLVAADPKVLPMGSLVQVDMASYRRGLYQVMDTGRLIKGRRIDIFIPSTESALAFGRQKVKLTVLRYGFLWQQAQQSAALKLQSEPSAP